MMKTMRCFKFILTHSGEDIKWEHWPEMEEVCRHSSN